MSEAARIGVCAVVCFSVAITGCDDGDTTPPVTAPNPMANGQMVYTAPLSTKSTFSCSTCHALAEPAADGLRRPGHQIGDATRRTSWKGGQVATFREAANTCLTEWMNTDPWSDTDIEYVALWDFLESNATTAGITTGQNITIQRVDPPVPPTGGDAVAGQALFNQSCIVCHGTDAVGTLRGPVLAGRNHTEEYITTRVRTSGSASSAIYPGLTGGIMPFWGADRLSDEEVRNLAAFVASSDPPPDPILNPEPDPDPVSTCGSTHAKVGWVAQLSTKFHMVSGTARIVDDCNIMLENFNYDGSGIDVRAYVALGGNYNAGVAIGPQLLKSDGYSSAKVMLGLGDGVTLDNIDGLSIWCVAVGTSFGDGLFVAP